MAPGERCSALTRKPVRAVVIATTTDQTDGLARELRDDFGFRTTSVLAEMVQPRRELPRAVHRAHLLVATEAHAERIAAVAKRLGKPHVVVSVRFDLYEAEWGRLRGQDVYVIVADPRFAGAVVGYLESQEAMKGVHVLLAGRDDISGVPAGPSCTPHRRPGRSSARCACRLAHCRRRERCRRSARARFSRRRSP